MPNIKHGIHDGEPMLFKFIKPRAQEEGEQEDTFKHHIASDNDDGDPVEDRDHLGSITMDVTDRQS